MLRSPARTLCAVSLAPVALIAIGASAHAHDFWLQPSRFVAKAGEAVSFGLRVGHEDEIDPIPYRKARVERFFAAIGTDAIELVDLEGREGLDPSAELELAQPGTVAVGYRSFDSRIELEAAKFEEYLREEGLERIVEQRKALGESQKPGRELYSRCAKALVRVTGAAGDASTGSETPVPAPAPSIPLGLTLELIAERDPYRLASDERLPVKLLLRGEPLEGALIEAVRMDPSHRTVGFRSDAKGRVEFALEPGPWRIAAVWMERAPKEMDADWKSLWATLTFEIPTPPAAEISKPREGDGR